MTSNKISKKQKTDKTKVKNTKKELNQENLVNSEIEELKKKLEIAEDKLLRSQADYTNLVKRTESESSKIYNFSEQKVILKLLPIIDDINRASSNIPKDISNENVIKWLEWFNAIVSGFNKLLENFDVKSFSSLWEEVDTNKHEVLSQWPGEEWKIVQEFEVWYTHKWSVIRPAKVVVGTWE